MCCSGCPTSARRHRSDPAHTISRLHITGRATQKTFGSVSPAVACKLPQDSPDPLPFRPPWCPTFPCTRCPKFRGKFRLQACALQNSVRYLPTWVMLHSNSLVQELLPRAGIFLLFLVCSIIPILDPRAHGVLAPGMENVLSRRRLCIVAAAAPVRHSRCLVFCQLYVLEKLGIIYTKRYLSRRRTVPTVPPSDHIDRLRRQQFSPAFAQKPAHIHHLCCSCTTSSTPAGLTSSSVWFLTHTLRQLLPLEMTPSLLVPTSSAVSLQMARVSSTNMSF